MKSKRTLIFLLTFGLLIMGGRSIGAEEQRTKNLPTIAEQDTFLGSQKKTDIPTDFDSILVIHFHPTVQCSCCINVGNFSQKGLKEFYSKPHQKLQFLFQEINIDEDTLAAKEYQVFGSALGFERLYKDKNEFKEIEAVWEFCEDEIKFLEVFKKELDGFINEPQADTTGIEQPDENSK
jgi:hypothetical protein